MHELLEDAYERYARPEFVLDDPVQVPKSFSDRTDREVIGFLTATIAWGQRSTIISNALRIAALMDQRPGAFVRDASEAEINTLARFVHRTFQGMDLVYFVRALRHLLKQHGSLENAFQPDDGPFDRTDVAISRFRDRFFDLPHAERTRKHVADPMRGSSAKRINMFLRWMVRPADRGVDMGLWTKIPLAALLIPLDVHTGRTARQLGLLVRTQNDNRAVHELTQNCIALDPLDPARYDIPLFALGVYEPELIIR